MDETTAPTELTGLPLPSLRLNRVLGWLLRSRLHGLASGSHLLVTYRGRRTGREIALPVRYARAGADFVVRVGRPDEKSWWRNFRSPWPMTVVHRGRPVEGIATAVRGSDPDGVRLASAYFARYPGAGRRLGLRLRHGEPSDPEQLRRAAAAVLLARMRPVGR